MRQHFLDEMVQAYMTWALSLRWFQKRPSLQSTAGDWNGESVRIFVCEALI